MQNNKILRIYDAIVYQSAEDLKMSVEDSASTKNYLLWGLAQAYCCLQTYSSPQSWKLQNQHEGLFYRFSNDQIKPKIKLEQTFSNMQPR